MSRLYNIRFLRYGDLKQEFVARTQFLYIEYYYLLERYFSIIIKFPFTIPIKTVLLIFHEKIAVFSPVIKKYKLWLKPTLLYLPESRIDINKIHVFLHNFVISLPVSMY